MEKDLYTLQEKLNSRIKDREQVAVLLKDLDEKLDSEDREILKIMADIRRLQRNGVTNNEVTGKKHAA